jgi:hypothetical protein
LIAFVKTVALEIVYEWPVDQFPTPMIPKCFLVDVDLDIDAIDFYGNWAAQSIEVSLPDRGTAKDLNSPYVPPVAPN